MPPASGNRKQMALSHEDHSRRFLGTEATNQGVGEQSSCFMAATLSSQPHPWEGREWLPEPRSRDCTEQLFTEKIEPCPSNPIGQEVSR